MKKVAIRIGILFAVFVISVVVTTLFMNRESTNNISELDPPTLPEVLVDMDGVLANHMYGYRQEMQVDFTRDSLTPVDTTRKIAIAVKPNDQKITSLSYEVRTSDGSKVVENQPVKDLVESDGYLRGEIQLITDNMLMNQEYSLQIQLDLADGPAYYYTRIVQRSRLYAAEYVEFVQGFYQKCLNKDASSELISYVESDASMSNNNFTSVNIHSSLSMITWGSMNPQISRQGVPLIKDINETTGSVLIKYQISAKDEENNRELYEVEDFYRMRYTQERVMLLDFERETRQVFDGNLPVTDSEGLNLGVVLKDVSYVGNSSADVVVFVENGDLWSYSHSACKLTRIFSFRRDENSDERDDHSEHDMKVLRVDESGDMDFVLYGYMNRGPHEGYVGTAVYHYSSTQNAMEERIFIPSTLSYEFLKRDLQKLSYVNENDQMYLMTEGKLFQIDIATRSYKVIVENIDEDRFVSTSNNAHAAWAAEGNADYATALTEYNFDTAQSRTITAGSGQFVKALGYMNEDLIYGLADEQNVGVTPEGETIFAMSRIKIENFDGTVKKDYTKDNLYVTQVNVSETLMEMELSEKNGETFQYRTSENIMNNKKAVEESVTLNMVYTERRGFITRLDFDQAVSNPNSVVVSAKVKTVEEDTIPDLDIQPQAAEAYYVYARGRLDSVFASPAQAILRADEKTGVVLNRRQQYVWERGNKRSKIQLDLGDILSPMLEGSLDVQALKESLGESAVILDLTGCSLDSVLYQVSMQRPVIAAMADGTSLVIVGYDEYNTIVYDPATKGTRYMGLNDSTNAFKQAGNVFISYIEVPEE